MIVVNNMRCLRGADSKKSSVGAFTLKFDLQKVIRF
jgi:syntaxin-binding protein 1